MVGLLGWSSHTPVYEASVSFTVKVANPLYAGVNAYNEKTAEQMAKTFPYILKSIFLLRFFFIIIFILKSFYFITYFRIDCVFINDTLY